MGSSQSVKDTPLGQSIVGKKFKTSRSTCLGYSGYDNMYYIKVWDDHYSLLNPAPETFELRILTPIEFIITDIFNDWNIETGYSIKLKGKILNNIPRKSIDYVRETIKGKMESNDINNIKSKFIPLIILDTVVTEGQEINVLYYTFGIDYPRIGQKVNCDKSMIFSNSNVVL